MKDVQIDCIFQRFGFVWHVRRNAKNFAGAHNDFFAINPELQRALQNVRQLLVVMAMLGYDTTFLQQHTCEHKLLAGDELTIEKGIQVFGFNFLPAQVFQHASIVIVGNVRDAWPKKKGPSDGTGLTSKNRISECAGCAPAGQER